MDQFDYSEFEGEADISSVGANARARLEGLAQDLLGAEALVVSLEEQVKEAKEALRDVKERRLPDLMDELGSVVFETPDGVVIKIAEAIRGSIPAANAEQAFAWLEEHGHGALVKRTITVEFGKGEEQWADRFERDCARRKKPLNLARRRGVHPQTLQAFVRGQLEEGVDVPMDTFGVFRQRFAKVKMPKGRK